MKFTNPTRRKELRRCPKRYYFRYFYKPGLDEALDYARRRRLYGIRELGGHLIHQAAADMVRAMAAGKGWSYATSGRMHRKIFLDVVAKSLAAAPGEWIDGLQLAETFNGASPSSIRDEVNHWSVLIPHAIENAWLAAQSLGLRLAKSAREIETERQFLWHKGGQTMHYVVDVLVREPKLTVCIDWKCHEIDNADIAQVRHYLDYLHYREKIPDNYLHGIAVNLITADIVEIRYRPHELGRRVSLASTLPTATLTTAKLREPFPANPDPGLCRSCPYAGICPALVKSAGIASGVRKELATVGDYFPSAALEGR
jgi:hypothetical protein